MVPTKHDVREQVQNKLNLPIAAYAQNLWQYINNYYVIDGYCPAMKQLTYSGYSSEFEHNTELEPFDASCIAELYDKVYALCVSKVL